MTSTTRTAFDVEINATAPGFNLPQRIGRLLWGPMLIMALMAFPLAFVLALVRADAVRQVPNDAAVIAALGHIVTGVMFIGFATVFAAVSFAIARILGTLRLGGGMVQEASGRPVETLRMLATAKAFLGLMAMGMMLLLGAVVAHLAVGVSILGGDARALSANESWAIGLEAVRRIGVVVFLVAITLGLATIAQSSASRRSASANSLVRRSSDRHGDAGAGSRVSPAGITTERRPAAS